VYTRRTDYLNADRRKHSERLVVSAVPATVVRSGKLGRSRLTVLIEMVGERGFQMYWGRCQAEVSLCKSMIFKGGSCCMLPHECEHDLDSEREPLRLHGGRVALYCRKCDSYVFKGTTSTGNLSGDDQVANVTSLEKRPGPSKAFRKDNGKWTFHIFPDGVAQEFGEYDTEEAAAEASDKILQIWQANGHTYGLIGTISDVITQISPPPPTR
jgi:hypothetical protein